MALKRKLANPNVEKRIKGLTANVVSLDIMKELFAFNVDDEQLIAPTDTLILRKSDDYVMDVNMRHMILQYLTSEKKNEIETTAGRFVANLFLFCGNENISQNIQYINKPFTKGVIMGIGSQIGRLLLEKIITSEDMFDYIDREQWLGFAPTKFIAPSFDEASLIPSDKMNKAKKDAAKKYKKEIDNVDVNGVNKMEKELLDLATSELEKADSGGLDIYASGASGSLGNNYRNTQVMRGLLPKSNDLTQMSVSLSNLTEGIPKEELAEYADLMVLASMSRAVGTQDGGYEVKKSNAAFQYIKAGKHGSDCGTKRTTKVLLTESEANDWYLSYIVDKGKLILLDSKTSKDYIGKTVELRTPMYCLDQDVCNHCLGELYYRLEIESIGLLLSRVGSNILNKFLKRFHDLTVKVIDQDILSSITFVE